MHSLRLTLQLEPIGKRVLWEGPYVHVKRSLPIARKPDGDKNSLHQRQLHRQILPVSPSPPVFLLLVIAGREKSELWTDL